MSLTLARRYTVNGPTEQVPVAPSGITMPGTYLIRPGQYTFHGNNYDMSVAGPYCLNYPVTAGEQLFKCVLGTIEDVMRAICEMTVAGNYDNGLDFNGQTSTMLHRRIGLTCQNTCNLVRDMMIFMLGQGMGTFPTRFVRFVTADPNDARNSFDSTHVCIEILIDNKWVFFDPTFDRWYGLYKTADDFVLGQGTGIIGGQNGTPLPPIKLCQTKTFPLLQPNTTYPMTGYQENSVCTPQDEIDWTNRVMRYVGVDVNGGSECWFYPIQGAESSQNFVLSYNPSVYKMKDYGTWRSTLYPNQ